jgi:GNAT superfamily N-acetyltransferase
VDKYILGFPDTVSGDMVKWAESFVVADKKVALVAEVAGERIGCIFGKIEESNMPMSVSGEIGTITVCWVAPDHRRSGVGRALLAKTETWFLARGIRHLEVAFMEKNETAREAWMHLGLRKEKKKEWQTTRSSVRSSRLWRISSNALLSGRRL